jgi:hypothetical protein
VKKDNTTGGEGLPFIPCGEPAVGRLAKNLGPGISGLHASLSQRQGTTPLAYFADTPDRATASWAG